MNRLLTLTAVALTATACTSPTTTKPAPSTAPPATQPAEPAKLGTTHTNTGPVTATATAYTYRVLASPRPPERDGYVWAGVNAKVCITTNTTGKQVPVTFYPWKLRFPDDTQAEPATQWSEDQFTAPIFTSRVMGTGCLRGWVVFEVPSGKRPVAVVYAPAGSGQSAEWAVPKS